MGASCRLSLGCRVTMAVLLGVVMRCHPGPELRFCQLVGEVASIAGCLLYAYIGSVVADGSGITMVLRSLRERFFVRV